MCSTNHSECFENGIKQVLFYDSFSSAPSTLYFLIVPNVFAFDVVVVVDMQVIVYSFLYMWSATLEMAKNVKRAWL